MEKFIDKIGRKIGKKLKEFFNLKDFSEIVIKHEVVAEIKQLASSAYPKEFFAFLEGEVNNERLIIKNLVFQMYQSSERAATPRINLPMLSNVFGTVHSHPSYSNNPSSADLMFFNRTGAVHLIICSPFSTENIQAYNFYGEKIIFSLE